MVIVWIRLIPSGDVTWAREMAAERLVASGHAEYCSGPGMAETAAVRPPENAATRTGRAQPRQKR